ncbi:MAG: hypothetical protein J6Y43_00145, partial [Clostridia bacterium]|nr:hypothetical protein [Clostridia bacterium]
KWMTVCYVKPGIDITDAEHGNDPANWGYTKVDHPTIPAWGEEPTYQSVGFPSVEGVEAYPAITYTVLSNPFDVYGITLTKIAAGGERTVISSDCGDWFGVNNLDSRVIRGNLPALETKGASVRIAADGKNGLRFAMDVDRTSYTSWFSNSDEHVRINKTGALVIPTSLINGDLKIGDANAQDVETTDLWQPYSDTQLRSYVYIFNIPSEAYEAGITIRPYVVYTDIDENKEYTVYCPAVERSLRSVAQLAYADVGFELDENALELLKLYAGVE